MTGMKSGMNAEMKTGMKRNINAAGKIAAGVAAAVLTAVIMHGCGKAPETRFVFKEGNRAYPARILEPADSLTAGKWNGVDYAAGIGGGMVVPINRDNLYRQVSSGDATYWRRISADYESARKYQDSRLGWGAGIRLAVMSRDTLYTVNSNNLLLGFDGLGYIPYAPKKSLEMQ